MFCNPSFSRLDNYTRVDIVGNVLLAFALTALSNMEDVEFNGLLALSAEGASFGFDLLPVEMLLEVLERCKGKR